MLRFLGIGSAFNTRLGNTSAYIKEGGNLLLIDSGGTVFHKMRSIDLFKDVKDIHIIITHTHPDHIGSLGEVIFYAYYILNVKPTIYYPDHELLRLLFKCIGVKEEMVLLKNDINIRINDRSIGEMNITFIKTSHSETVSAYGVLLKKRSETAYYSGDSNSIPEIIMEQLLNETLDYLYQDTCGLDYDGNAHLSLNKLEQLIPVEFRSKVYCMHLDEHLSKNKINELGFNVPKLERK